MRGKLARLALARLFNAGADPGLITPDLRYGGEIGWDDQRTLGSILD